MSSPNDRLDCSDMDQVIAEMVKRERMGKLKPFELSLEAKAHASFNQWDRAHREIVTALATARAQVWDRVADAGDDLIRQGPLHTDILLLTQWCREQAAKVRVGG